MFVGPCPRVLEELLAGEVALLDALFGKAVDDFCFCRYGSVVGARHPACVLAVEASLANEDVLNGVVEHVAHVEDTGHIGWGDDDSVWLS